MRAWIHWNPKGPSNENMLVSYAMTEAIRKISGPHHSIAIDMHQNSYFDEGKVPYIYRFSGGWVKKNFPEFYDEIMI